MLGCNYSPAHGKNNGTQGNHPDKSCNFPLCVERMHAVRLTGASAGVGQREKVKDPEQDWPTVLGEKMPQKGLYGEARRRFPSPYSSSGFRGRACCSVVLLPLISCTESSLGKPEDTVNEGIKGVTSILYDLYLMIELQSNGRWGSLGR